MKPVYQTKFGGSDAPESEQGNCLQAALASVFELPIGEVPNFAGHIEDFSWWRILQAWLAQWNLTLTPVNIDNGCPEGICLMACKSTTLKHPEDGHVVVMKDRIQVHDPNPRAVKVGEPEQYWCFTVLDPAKQVTNEAQS